MLEDLDSTQCNIISDVLGYGGGTCLPSWSGYLGYICQWLPGYTNLDRHCHIISGTGHMLRCTMVTSPLCSDSSVTTVWIRFY